MNFKRSFLPIEETRIANKNTSRHDGTYMCLETLSAISNIATAFGTFIAVGGLMALCYQIWDSKTQAMSDFEDDLAREYREIIATLPVLALLGQKMGKDEIDNHLPQFYRYFDLCNEQAFLHEQRRVRPETWAFWEEGIVTNLLRDPFARAWLVIKRSAGEQEFSELKRLISNHKVLIDKHAEISSVI